ncbi:PilX N-terminal domain-containing pilus assembly protein [Psychrobacter maritimus]|uniref:PilX N-terminal domain-containing pilus assembly protein n=1 Tax=Psychrobacter maritimus TaxID=256325 RepID=UPI00191A84E4|nr:PilX N-terminal domain-containing pilus assembly protein [Psychrobacter maritimus]
MKPKTIGNLKPSTIPHNQSGVALIVVLLVLILIMIVGAIAVRKSTTDLKVSTADQVNKLLFQANDAALLKVEKEDRILSAASRDKNDTLKGYMSSSEREGHKISFCVRPRSTKLFSILEISELDKNNALLTARNNGYCNPSDSNDYVSEGRVITQMTFERSDCGGIFCQEGSGTSSNNVEPTTTGVNAAIGCTTFIGYVTSVIPALSSAPLGDANSNDTTSIAGCFKQLRTGANTVDSCLTALSVPYQTQQQTYINQPVGVTCVSGS